MKRRQVASLLLLAVACARLASAETLVPARLAPLLDAASDRVVRRSFVPSEAQKVGEVRLLRRGTNDVVETLLYSKVLARVVEEIRKKELANWPPDQPGRDDVLRYVAALESVQKQIWDRRPRSKIVRDRRLRDGRDERRGARLATRAARRVRAVAGLRRAQHALDHSRFVP